MAYGKPLLRSLIQCMYPHVGRLRLPAPAPLPGTRLRGSFMFALDEAFPMKEYLLHPYPGRDIAVVVTKKILLLPPLFGSAENRK